MDCDEFLRGYSGFRDRRAAPPARRRYREHLERCSSCRRYDHVVRRGVRLLRAMPSPCPSADFFPRLKHRIYHLEDGGSLFDSASGGSAALAALATVGLLALAWLPLALQPPAEVELDPVAVERRGEAGPSAAPASLFGSGPWVTPLLEGGDAPDRAGSARPGWPAGAPPGDAMPPFSGRGADPGQAGLQLR